jgi:phospholipid/cholesterol/gamma-HCH transport system permease protein
MPKAIALMIVTPLLTALFVVFGLAGAYIIGVVVLGLDGGLFLSSLEAIITFDEDVLQSGTKGLMFGILVGLVATFRGYSSAPTAEGVSAATTASVVVSSLCILVADYVITAFWGL